MASVLEQGQLRSVFSSSQPSNTITTPVFPAQSGYTLNRPTTFRASNTSSDAVFGSSSWGNGSSIWKTSTSHFGGQGDRQPIGVSDAQSEKLQSSELTSQSASTHAPDKKPLLRKVNTYASQKDAGPEASDAPRYVPSPNAFQSSITTRSTTHLASPTRNRAQGVLTSGTVPFMPTLSNASLLSGSAPDFETSPKSSHSSHLTHVENQFKNLNLGRVNVFVPSWQKRQDQPHGFAQNHGRCSCNDCFQSFVAPSHHNVNSGPEHFRDLDLSNHPRRSSHNSSWPASSFGHPGDKGASFQEQVLETPFFGNPESSKAQSELWSSANLSEDVQLEAAGYPWARQFDRSSDDLQPHRTDNPYSAQSQFVGEFPFSQSSESYRIAVDNQLAYLGNRDTIAGPNHTLKNGLYTPAFTPPTASESHRSTSASAPSTRASSQTVDSRLQNLDSYPTIENTFSPHEYGTANNSCPPYPYHNGFPDMYQPRSMPHANRPEPGMPAESREDPNKPVSPFLREFKANCKTRNYTLRDVYNYIVEFSGDQHGSRFIQDKLSSANSDEKERVFAEVRENALQLMTDIFGNYVVQKMFEHGTQAQKKSLANQMKGRVLYLTTQVYGCRVVQKALEHVLVEQQASIVQELCGHVLPIVENQNGNHVIQKAIELVPSEHIGFIADALQGQAVRLAKHNYGCRVIQRMLEYSETRIRKAIFEELSPDIPSLITDTFGNYVVQNIIRSKKPKEAEDADDQRNRTLVVEMVKQQLLYYSKHKFASNVVEVAIDFSSETQQHEILRGLTGSDGNGPSPVSNLIRDQYGNYVIQKVLSKVRGQQCLDLIREIRQHVNALRRIHNGRQVAAMERALMDAINAHGPSLASLGLYNSSSYSHHFGSDRAAFAPYSQHRHPGSFGFLPMQNIRAQPGI